MILRTSKIVSLTFISVLAILLMAFASNKKEQSYIYITGTRFTYPLIEKWIEEYQKVNPHSQIKLIRKGLEFNTDSVNLTVVAHKIDKEELKDNNTAIEIGRYALLPIANEKNSLVKRTDKNGIEEKELKAIFIKSEEENDDLLENDERKKVKVIPYTIYTRLAVADAAISFAAHFAATQSDIRGKTISGDDNYLIQAILKDTSGLTYNNLGFIYNLQNRHVQNGIAVLKIDVNNNGKLDGEEKTIYHNLDSLITYLEKNENQKAIPVENISFVFEKNVNNKELQQFLNWVLVDGQEYNHEFGFLNFNQKIASSQIEILKNNLN